MMTTFLARAARLLRPAVFLAALALAATLIAGLALPLRAQAQSAITSPAPGSAISGDVTIQGTAVIEPFQKYELHYKLEPSGDDAYIYFDGRTSPVVNGQLGVWRASGLPPGTYSLRLRVVKADGNYAEYFSPNLTLNQGAAATPTLAASPTFTPTATPTFTPAPSPTPNVGAVQQPQLDAPPTVAVAPAADVAAAPAAAVPLTATGSAQTGVIVNPDGTLSGETAADSADTATGLGSATRSLGEALSLDRLRAAFFRGMRYAAAIFLVVAVLIGGRWAFGWARRRFG
jgi:hypothetical protein